MISSNEIWVKIGGNKGGGSFKIVFEIANLGNPNATANTVIFTMFEASDTPDNLNQWWRLIIPLFMHAGAIQLVLNMVVQYYCGSNIEAQAGFLRACTTSSYLSLSSILSLGDFRLMS